ncbi:AAA family ATPase [Lyngbya confervoides]|uniref:Nuclease SbcCD subunit C n=1 Tax=Lyngbya confervoides BDU141951 TaxID=1574623 RepID=A0ABD4T0B8_9CYAN|nr:AAA family ATPase [Lyngbya confervoides]MCM1982157.1 AAA family ATPase [Lyngbya confervoides BDU141951]
MKLLSLKLHNFRSFYGEHRLTFAKSRDRNITVIHGNNGSGKTALLNAFTWALYEKFTAALASPEQVVNRRAIAEAKLKTTVDCWVEVGFEHDGKQYRVKRSCRAQKTKDGADQSRSDLFMQFSGDDGRWLLLPNGQKPEDVISRILPKSLHQYFFFDGERIEQIWRVDKRPEIAEATKKLLGVEAIDRAIKHLTLARKSLEEELGGIGDAETQHLLAEKKQLETEQEEIQTWMEEVETELAAQLEVKHTLQQKLLELSEVEQRQRQRELLQSQDQDLRDRLLAAKKNLKRLISTRGYTVFLPPIAAKFREIVKDREQKGELPADIKQTFVQDLLDRERCICGAELHEGSSHREAVQAWLEKAGLADVEAATYRVQAQVDELERQIPEFWREVDQEQATIRQIKQKIGQINEELDEIGEQLRQSSREDVRNLQLRLDSVEHRIESYTLEKGQNQEREVRLDQAIRQLNKQLKERKQNKGRQKLAQDRISAAQDAVDRLKQLKVNQDVLFREQLEAEIAQLYGEISFKPYQPRLSERYELSLVNVEEDPDNAVGASTGENQILSLAFIGSIIERVRQWSKAGLIMGPDSSTFPVVMDSPFGSLDSLYRRQVAKLLPGLADQMVVMVSKTQWRTEVAEEMQDRIGREYVLTYNSPKSELAIDDIERGGERYPLVRQSPNEFEYTEVIEVSRHG